MKGFIFICAPHMMLADYQYIADLFTEKFRPPEHVINTNIKINFSIKVFYIYIYTVIVI